MCDCGTDASIINCIISGNTITCSCNFSGGGGGVNVFHTGKLENCLISQTITVAGGGTTFIVENGGIVTMIAGHSIDYLTGTRVYAGGYMHGKIAPAGPYCGAKSASFVSSAAETIEKPIIPDKLNFRVYPNPTNGKFRLVLTGEMQTEPMQVEIYGMRGELVLTVRNCSQSSGPVA